MTNVTPLFAVAALLAAAACADGSRLPEGARILDGRYVAEMLHQCSRATPAAGEATWQPHAADIVALEAALPGALRALPAPSSVDWQDVPNGWTRKYVGIVRGGRRFVYGSFEPGRANGSIVTATRLASLTVCDGGPAFFGAEYDVQANRITHLAFNGEV